MVSDGITREVEKVGNLSFESSGARYKKKCDL